MKDTSHNAAHVEANHVDGSSSFGSSEPSLGSSRTPSSDSSASAWKMLLLQASAASFAGLACAPLMNISNKCTLPGIELSAVLKQTAAQPFLGALWSGARQFISSIRGTVAVTVLTSSAASQPNGIITAGTFLTAVLAGGTAETFLAGVLVEIPETRVQSGLSRFSFNAVRSFPFILFRNCMTAISPTFIIMQTMNLKRQQQLDRAAWEEKGASGLDKQQTPLKATPAEWRQAILRTLAMSTSVAVLMSPIQGISSRLIQEQSLKSAISNTRADFRWENKSTTIARVFSRALYTGCTGSAITVAFLTGRAYFEI